MATYTPPAGDALDINLDGAYTPPAGDALNIDLNTVPSGLKRYFRISAALSSNSLSLNEIVIYGEGQEDITPAVVALTSTKTPDSGTLGNLDDGNLTTGGLWTVPGDFDAIYDFGASADVLVTSIALAGGANANDFPTQLDLHWASDIGGPWTLWKVLTVLPYPGANTLTALMQVNPTVVPGFFPGPVTSTGDLTINALRLSYSSVDFAMSGGATVTPWSITEGTVAFVGTIGATVLGTRIQTAGASFLGSGNLEPIDAIRIRSGSFVPAGTGSLLVGGTNLGDHGSVAFPGTSELTATGRLLQSGSVAFPGAGGFSVNASVVGYVQCGAGEYGPWNQWNNLTEPGAFTQISRNGICSDGIKIYSMGGLTGSSSEASAEVWAYDIIAQSWSQLADHPRRLYGGICVHHKGAIYWYGGIDADHDGAGSENESALLWRYDLSTETAESSLIVGSPTPREGMSFAQIGHLIYFFGGKTDGIYYSELKLLDLERSTITALDDPSTVDEYHVEYSAMWYRNKKLYVFGGLDTNRVVISRKLLEYDIVTDTWTDLGNQLTGPSPRFGAGYCSFGGKFYLYGGKVGTGASDFTNQIWEYDLGTTTWTLLAQTMPTAMAWFGSTLDENVLYGFGGSDSGGLYGKDFHSYALPLAIQSVTGVYTDREGNPHAVPIRLYERSTGELLGATVSDAAGAWLITTCTAMDEVFVVATAPNTNNNAAIIDGMLITT